MCLCDEYVISNFDKALKNNVIYIIFKSSDSSCISNLTDNLKDSLIATPSFYLHKKSTSEQGVKVSSFSFISLSYGYKLTRR
jgi:hypothetical protein